MPGFYVSNIKADIALQNKYPNRCMQESITNERFVLKRNTLHKFMDDKCFCETKRLIIILEGYILNKTELLLQHNQSDWKECLEELFVNDKSCFRYFRGSFSGAVYYKEEKKWILYTNHIGDSPLFYYENGGKFAVASQVNYLLELFKQENIKISICEQAVYEMLTFGYMESNRTYSNEIKRLTAGNYMEIGETGKCVVKSYHRFKRNDVVTHNLSEKELIEKIDAAFCNAVKMEFEKDREYGYSHLSDLSGGLDSRMTTWCAYEMGYSPQLNITYCRSNYEDELIAKEIAGYCGNDILVKSLDDLNFIYDIDDLIEMNYGLSFYSGITGGKRLLEALNGDKYGIEHTGQLGDAILGTYCHSVQEYNSKGIVGYYSAKLISKISESYRKNFDDAELYKLYVRGFNGILCTHMTRKNYFEVGSPFLDVDFLELCYSIPFEIRYNQKLYELWIKEKYIDAAQFKWERIHDRITASPLERKARWFVRKVKNRIRYELKIPSVENMNPYEYWYKTSAHMRNFMKDEYTAFDKWDLLSTDLRKDMQEFFKTGKVIEKIQVLTALKSIEYYTNYGRFDTSNKAKEN